MLTRRKFGLIGAGAVMNAMAAEKEQLMYIGTYTQGSSKGIYVYRFNPTTGKMTEIGLAAEMENPSFVYVTPNGKHLYSVGETSSGTAAAFSADGSGKLTKLNQQPTNGDAPCHITADKAGRVLLVANYNSGSVTAFKLQPNGSIGEQTALVKHQGSSVDPKRQTSPHAHSVNLSKNEKFVVVGDLGLDQFIVYALDASKGTLTQHSAAKVKPGGGPRHFSFHPTYKYAYGIHEMGGMVSVFDWNEATGELKEKQAISTLPADYSGEKSCAEVLVHPSGKFVYGSNRGNSTLAMFSAAADGKLTMIGNVSTEGKTPRNFRIHASGDWLLAANQDSGNIVVFKIDNSSGKLAATGEQAKVPFPVCIKFV